MLHDQGVINKNIVSYNITFDPFGSCDGSYVQLGDISKEVQKDITWIKTPGWENWGIDI